MPSGGSVIVGSNSTAVIWASATMRSWAQSGEREVVRFWRLGMGVFFGGSSSPEKAKSTSSVSGFSSF
jgi:hypothetical protein